jgi:hypothetical protein
MRKEDVTCVLDIRELEKDGACELEEDGLCGLDIRTLELVADGPCVLEELELDEDGTWVLEKLEVDEDGNWAELELYNEADEELELCVLDIEGPMLEELEDDSCPVLD